MSKNERITDFFIGNLLSYANIDFTPNSSNIKEINDALKTASKKGTGKVGYPEFTAKSGDFILVIEDKALIDFQAKYKDEEKTNLATDKKSITDYAANGALHYAKEIISKTTFKQIFAFGCSGDEKHHIITPIFVDESGYKILQPVENFENFSTENIDKYYHEQVLGETPIEILETEEILRKAKDLHEYLRDYGALGAKEKPLVVSGILLALKETTFKIDALVGDDIKTDGEILFEAISTYLTRVKVRPAVKLKLVLDEFLIIKNNTKINQKDESLKIEIRKDLYLEKTPLRFFTEYIKDNVINHINTNSSEDILGRFFGEFVSYGGGDGQSLGEVLTPKHITELFCELIELKPTDKVFDPCCGTGGFLIAAMHKMSEKAQDETEINKIKQEQLHGIELKETMFAIATTNMVLRGDGKSNLIKDDFLKTSSKELRKNDYSVGFMNPPYSQGKKTSKHLYEINFIKHLLDSLADNAKCLVIVPLSTMTGGRDKTTINNVKKQILKSHTLEGVITLNIETFHGVGTNPCIAIFTAHNPHPKEKFCKFINFEDDGHVVSKHSGLIKTERAIERKAHLLNVWLNDAPAESKFLVKTTIEPEDEWLHSYYYFNDEIPKQNDFLKTIANYKTFEFNMVVQGLSNFFLLDKKIKTSKRINVKPLSEKSWKEFYLKDIFPQIQRGKRLKKADHIAGRTPYVSSTAMYNGVDNMIGNSESVRIFKNCLTIANSGSVGACFFHPYSFVASDHVTMLKNDRLNKFSYQFIATVVSRLGEKYSFNREINDDRIKKEKIMLPVNNKEEPDYTYMTSYMQNIEQQIMSDYLNYSETE